MQLIKWNMNYHKDIIRRYNKIIDIRIPRFIGDGFHSSWSFKTLSNYLRTCDMNPRQFSPVRFAHAYTIFCTNSYSIKLDVWLTLVRTALNASSTIFTIYKLQVMVVDNIRGVFNKGILEGNKLDFLKNYTPDYMVHWRWSSALFSEAHWRLLAPYENWGCHKTRHMSPNN